MSLSGPDHLILFPVFTGGFLTVNGKGVSYCSFCTSIGEESKVYLRYHEAVIHQLPFLLSCESLKVLDITNSQCGLVFLSHNLIITELTAVSS